LNIGARRITVSTCGVVPGIRRLASEQLQVELSVSLHAPTDPLRSSLMPVNRKYGIKELMDACEEYTHKTGRIVTFEYTLIGGTNDSTSHARRLVTLLSRFSCRVNLIPLSRVEEYEGKPSGGANARQFAAILNDSGINCTVRRSLGSDLNAACGQLRIRH
jgi:23S rRNA (adenine2503-C2)-methyltransferase